MRSKSFPLAFFVAALFLFASTSSQVEAADEAFIAQPTDSAFTQKAFERSPLIPEATKEDPEFRYASGALFRHTDGDYIYALADSWPRVKDFFRELQSPLGRLEGIRRAVAAGRLSTSGKDLSASLQVVPLAVGLRIDAGLGASASRLKWRPHLRLGGRFYSAGDDFTGLGAGAGVAMSDYVLFNSDLPLLDQFENGSDSRSGMASLFFGIEDFHRTSPSGSKIKDFGIIYFGFLGGSGASKDATARIPISPAFRTKEGRLVSQMTQLERKMIDAVHQLRLDLAFEYLSKYSQGVSEIESRLAESWMNGRPASADTSTLILGSIRNAFEPSLFHRGKFKKESSPRITNVPSWRQRIGYAFLGASMAFASAGIISPEFRTKCGNALSRVTGIDFVAEK